MKTEIIKIDPGTIEIDKIDAIVNVLKNEGVIVYPTDTFYGLGANFYSQAAEKRIFRLKRRDPSKPLSVVISDVGMLESMGVEIPPVFYRISSEFWPGPLTIIFRLKGKHEGGRRCSFDSVGVRLPGHRWLRELVRQACFPVTASSANISGEREISDPSQAIKAFSGKVDLIVDGGRTAGTLPSTVVDLRPERPTIIREGAIPGSVLKKYTG